MIARIRSKNPQHFAFRAMLSGLLVDPVSPGLMDVTYQDPHKILGVIREAGGTVVKVSRFIPLTKAEMHPNGK